MRLHHISGDQVVFLYDHSIGERPRVGDSYLVQEIIDSNAEKGTNGVGLVVQLVALETFNYPSLNEVLMRQIMEDSYGTDQVQTFASNANAPQIDNLGQAVGKVRRLQHPDGSWGIWNGYVASRNVAITKIDDDTLFRNCGLIDLKHPLSLGTTLDGRNFAIEGRLFEKVNIISALKGMGKSHLAKVLILDLIEHGMVSVVFDMNREYLGLPELQIDEKGFSSYKNLGEIPESPRKLEAGTVFLSASQNLRFTIEGFGRQSFIRLFEQYSPTENTRNVFETKVNEAFEQLVEMDLANSQDPNNPRPRPFVNIDFIRNLFDVKKTNELVRNAIMDRLDSIEAIHLFAETLEEGTSFDRVYKLCALKGGAIVIDLARLSSRFGREAFVGATLDMVQHIGRNGEDLPLPFVFFEEAHLYASGERIENLVTRARHLGVTSTFVTNMVTHLNDTVLRQVDNLFLLYLPHKDDVRHVAKSATTDEETVSAFAQRIERHHAMVVGPATGNYPIVFKVDPLNGVDTRGRTRYAFPE